MADTGAAVGTTFSLLEIFLCFSLGRFLALMWILINALQFVVFFGIWLITFPNLLTVVLNELKRATWGEYVDDLEIGDRISEFLWGANSETSENSMQKTGDDKLGSPNLFKSIGISVLILSFLFFLTIALVVLIVVCCRGKSLSEAN